METGKVEYSPDYKSEPNLPKDFGRMATVCADGKHRYLPGAAMCGCGEKMDPAVQHDHLREVVAHAAITWLRAQGDADHPAEVDATRIVVVRAWFALHKAVQSLIEFESKHDLTK